MKHAERAPASPRRRSADSEHSAVPGGAETLADQSPALTVQRSFALMVGQSPRLVAQRRQLGHVLGPAEPDRGAPLQRKPSRGQGWTAGVSLGGWVGWNQTQIDAEWKKIEAGHNGLQQKMDGAKRAAEQVTDASGAANGIEQAKAAHTKWDKVIDWPDRTKALQEIEDAHRELDTALRALAQARQHETEGLREALSTMVADKLLGKTFSPARLFAILEELSAEPMRLIAEPITVKQFAAIVDAENVTWDDLKKLSRLGGPTVFALCDSGLDLEELAKGSTAEDVHAAFSALTTTALERLQSLGAATIVSSLVKPLGPLVTERIATLTLDEIQALLKTVDAAVIRGIVEVKPTWVLPLHADRDLVRAILKNMSAADFVECWKFVTPELLRKLWQNKPAKIVAAALSAVGKVALKSLMQDLSQDEFWHASARLGNPALQGMGEAMRGTDLLTLSGGLGNAPAVAAPDTLAHPTDAVLTTLGKDHGALTKASKQRLKFATFNMVVRSCQAGGLDATGIASFLAKAETHKWKKPAPLKAFFDKAGANINAVVAIAEDFAAAGNDGGHADAAGGGAPATAVHTRTIGTRTFKVAQGDIKHYMAGHSYSHYAMTDENASRGDSSMWGTAAGEAAIAADAATVLNHVTFGVWAPGVAAYAERTIGGWRVGLDPANGDRLTKLFPQGATLAQFRMEAVAKLFQSQEA